MTFPCTYACLCLGFDCTAMLINKRHYFIVIFNMGLHGDSENDHKNANGLQSEAFKKYSENGLQADAKNGRTLLVKANGHVTIAFSCRFHGIYMNSIEHERLLKF